MYPPWHDLCKDWLGTVRTVPSHHCKYHAHPHSKKSQRAFLQTLHSLSAENSRSSLYQLSLSLRASEIVKKEEMRIGRDWSFKELCDVVKSWHSGLTKEKKGQLTAKPNITSIIKTNWIAWWDRWGFYELCLYACVRKILFMLATKKEKKKSMGITKSSSHREWVTSLSIQHDIRAEALKSESDSKVQKLQS